jgi:hypothetical protein
VQWFSYFYILSTACHGKTVRDGWDILQAKYVNKCELLKNVTCFGSARCPAGALGLKQNGPFQDTSFCRPVTRGSSPPLLVVKASPLKKEFLWCSSGTLSCTILKTINICYSARGCRREHRHPTKRFLTKWYIDCNVIYTWTRTGNINAVCKQANEILIRTETYMFQNFSSLFISFTRFRLAIFLDLPWHLCQIPSQPLQIILDGLINLC